MFCFEAPNETSFYRPILCGAQISVGLIALKELHKNGHDFKEGGFFSDFGDRLIVSAVVADF